MYHPKRPLMAAAASCAAVICVAQAAIPAHAEDRSAGKIVKPLAAFSVGIGSKQVVGYFVADAHDCNLTLIMADAITGDSMASDEVPKSTPMRIQQTIASNTKTRMDTSEGQSLEFNCQNGAAAMSVRKLTNVAVYKAR